MNKLRQDEEFVIKVLAEIFDVNWYPGENPPDAYLKFNNKTVAVEISTLTQPTIKGTGFRNERRSDDVSALRLCHELNYELKDQIPKGTYIFLYLSSPIQKLRKFKSLLEKKIIGYLSKKIEFDFEDIILGNKFKIHIGFGELPSGRKIICIIGNNRSNPDVLANALFTLNDRLEVKSKKIKAIKHNGECWLALLNDYLEADDITYRRAMSLSKVDHHFTRVYIVFDSNKVIQIA
jgi:hypothetical protein